MTGAKTNRETGAVLTETMTGRKRREKIEYYKSYARNFVFYLLAKKKPLTLGLQMLTSESQLCKRIS